jgi:hypothetical protein
MPKLTKADAARQLDIARSTLYKLIQQGKVSPTPDGLVDQAELVRVAAYVDILKGRLRTPTRHPHYHRVRRLTDKPCHDLLYISGAFRRLYPVDLQLASWGGRNLNTLAQTSDRSR